jgi:hypothetical protein
MKFKTYFISYYPMVLFIFGCFLLTMAVWKVRELKLQEVKHDVAITTRVKLLPTPKPIKFTDKYPVISI